MTTVETAIVVEGGAMRGIFSAGVLDRLLEEQLSGFDLAIGTSAGAANLASFVAGQHERNLRCYTRIMTRRELFDLRRFARGGHLMDLDWLWDRFAEEDPLDEDAINRSPTMLVSVGTCAESGRALYHHQTGAVHAGLKAGCALPILYRGPILLSDRPIVDGGVSDAIPVREAYRRGARKVVVVRSRPAAAVKTKNPTDALAAALAWKRPGLSRALLWSHKQYADAVRFMAEPPADLELVHIAPPRRMATGRTTQDLAVLLKDYALGRAEGERHVTRVRALLQPGAAPKADPIDGGSATSE